MAGLLRNSRLSNNQELRGDGSGDISPEPVNPPATSYANVQSPLTAREVIPPTPSNPHNAPIVNRNNRTDGMQSHYVYGGQPEGVPGYAIPPRSSRFQQTLIRLSPWFINTKWYIAYPAATVMNGGKHNLGLAERTPQITTRVTGGPGDIRMTARPAFKRVQMVPRFSAAPATYDTKSANG